MNIKKSIATAAVMAIGLAIGVPARADTYYNFSYSDSSNNMASGTLSIVAVNDQASTSRTLRVHSMAITSPGFSRLVLAAPLPTITTYSI